MKYVVTGGAGFIGSHVTEALLAEGHDVVIVDDLSTGKEENVPVGAQLVKADIREREKLTPIFKGADGVFHLAAIAALQHSIEHPIDTNGVNIIGTLNVLLSARDAGVRRVVVTSSCAVYGNAGDNVKREDASVSPASPYGLEKYAGEHYARLAAELYGLQTAVLRYFNVYGPRMAATGGYASVIKNLLTKCEAGEPLQITGDGEQTRDFIHVSDVARANLLAVKSDHVGKGEVINVGSGVSTSINRVAELIVGAPIADLKAQSKVIYIPDRPGEIRLIAADTTKAKQLLDWSPQVSLEEGIKTLSSQT